MFSSHNPRTGYIDEAVTDLLKLLCTQEWISSIALTACSALSSCSYMYGKSIDDIITNASSVGMISHTTYQQWHGYGIEYIFNIQNTAHISWMYDAYVFSIAKEDDRSVMKPSCSVSYQIHTVPSAFEAYISFDDVIMWQGFVHWTRILEFDNKRISWHAESSSNYSWLRWVAFIMITRKCNIHDNRVH